MKWTNQVGGSLGDVCVVLAVDPGAALPIRLNGICPYSQTIKLFKRIRIKKLFIILRKHTWKWIQLNQQVSNYIYTEIQSLEYNLNFPT